jgi:hypothetical protein
MIYSNTVTENVSAYTVTLASNNLNPIQYNNVTFTATLDLNAVPAGAGKTISFYQGATLLGTNLTDSNGVAVYTVNMTNIGALEFKAGFLVP